MSQLKCYFFYVVLMATSTINQVSLTALNKKIVPFRTGSEYLDPENKYLLAWSIDEEKETIYFEVVAETKGYVGFGISPKGGMTGADILIAGVHPNGNVYSGDYHGESNSQPITDTYSNWVITAAVETETHTNLTFHRLLNTCDTNDMEITDGTVRLIYALGETDTISYHNANRGTKSVNFYMQDEHEFDPSQFESVTITHTMVMPPEDTTYWCTMHRTPLFSTKQHVVSFEPVLKTNPAVQHTHHFILFRCTAPKGTNPEELFGPWVGHNGDLCYDPTNSSFPFLEYCSTTQLYDWSKGGKQLVFPPELGLPIPENLNEPDFYALEIHYDNPQMLQGVEFESGVKVYYTSELREIDVGLWLVNHDYQAQLLIPPNTEDYLIAGHCSSECLQLVLPEEGITIFNNLFHAHLAGRKMKLRHFRGEEELPWVDVDEHFDFAFQQNKPLTQYRQVFKGDQLTVECNMDSTTAEEGKAIVGGVGSREEMCEAIFYYYPKLPLFWCGSHQEITQHMNLLGVTNFTKREDVGGEIPEYIITAPEHLAGNYLDSVSSKVNWTPEFREEFQQKKRFGEQVCTCATVEEEYYFPVSYPKNVAAYVPPDECAGKTESPPAENTTPECKENCSGGINIQSTIFAKYLAVIVIFIYASIVFSN